MAKNFFFLLFALSFSLVVFAQKDYNTAYNSYKSYMDYDKSDKKTGSLQKALEAVLKAEEAANAQMSTESKPKDSYMAKVYNLKAKIYAEMLQVKGSPLAEGAGTEVFKAVQSVSKYDKKGEYTEESKLALMLIYSDIYNRGVEGFKVQNYQVAYDNFNTAIEVTNLTNKMTNQKGIDTAAIQSAAVAAQKLKNSDKAIELYESLINANVKDENVYLAVMDLYSGKGDKAKAEETMNRAKKVFPNSNAFLLNEINSLLNANKKEEAVAQLEKAAALYPDNASLFVAMGSTYEGMKMPQKAEEAYKKAIAIDPKTFDAQYNLGVMNYQRAADIINEANKLPLNEEKKYDALMKEANEWFKKALPYFSAALDLNGKDANTLLALKEIYAKLNDATKAAEFKKRLDELSTPKK
jgi:tetratricopeptide (TPR) repeat protein